MNRLFDVNGPVMGFLTKIVYSVYLNILWFVCCLPIVTAGASTTALFYVTLKIVKNEEGHITRAFFHSFKENFRQATVIWLILLVLGIVLGVDGYVFYHMRFDSVLWTLGTAVFIVAAAAYLIVLMYIFPLLARFENTTRAMFKNAVMIGMRFLLCTALMAAIYFAMVLVVVRIFTPAVIFGEGLCALLCSYFLSNILALCEGTPQPSSEPDLPAFGEEPEIKMPQEAAQKKAASQKQPPQEKQSQEKPQKQPRRLRELHGKARLQYLFDYYKLPFFAGCIVLYIAGYALYGHFTHKDTVLYTALVNINAGDELTSQLSGGFLKYAGRDASKEKLELYTNWYLTGDAGSANYSYTSATSTKIVASIDRECLDVVLMNREAFDAFSQNGYLLNMETFLRENAPQLLDRLQDSLVSNTVSQEEQTPDAQPDPSAAQSSGTDEYPAGIDLSQSPLISQAGFDDTAYLGVIANTPRTEAVVSYLQYLYS